MSRDIVLDVCNLLSNQYDILYVKKVKDFFESPVNTLYQELRTQYRESYESHQRIVLIDNLDSHSQKPAFYNLLQRVLTHLDITNFFVLVVSSDPNVHTMLVDAQEKYAHDTTSIEFLNLLMPVETAGIVTNFLLPDTLCVTPWINLEVRAQGNLAPCCLYQADYYPSIINLSLLETMQSTALVDLRQQFLQGQKPKACVKCWKDEAAGHKSKRQQDNYVFRDKRFDIDWNNLQDIELVSLDIKLKNTCNLSCRICSPLYSSQWYSEVVRHPDKYPAKFTRIKNEWTDDTSSNLWQDIIKIGKNIRYVTFTGGEPLLDKSHIHLLKYLIKIGVSDKTYLHYNTNGTVYANNLIPLWNKFKTVELSFSIDNLFEKFEYERHGAAWQDVVDNINQYQLLNTEIYNVNVYSTVSALNILDSYEVYSYFKTKHIPIYMGILDSPDELSVKVLDDNTKNCITKKIKSIDDEDYQTIIKPILTYMQLKSEDYGVESFVDYLSTTDNVRKQNFKELYKELTLMLEI